MSQASEYTEDSYDTDDFLHNWNIFIKQYRYEFPLNLLSKYGFKNFDLDDLTRVVVSATKGEQDGLNRIENVRKYLRETFYHIKTNFQGYDDDYWQLDEIKEDFQEILEDLKPENFKKIINLATPEEKMMVRSISRQANTKLPEDIQKEIISHIGYGGRRRKKTKSKRRKSMRLLRKVKKARSMKQKKRTLRHK